MRVVATAMRVAGDKEGEGGIGMVRMKKIASEQQQRQQRGQWR